MKTLNPPPRSTTPSLLGAPPLSEALPGGSGLASVRVAREFDPQPTWFRLTADSWAMIRAEYLAGATAKQLAMKWKVSPTSIYRHACDEGWTKEGRAKAIDAEAKARAGAEAVAQHRRDQEAAAMYPGEALGADVGFAGAAPSEASPDQVATLALGAAARCIAAGRFVEAERLAKMAETLSRLAGGSGGPGFAPHAAIRGSSDPWDTPARDEPRERTPEEMMALRAEVERRFERLARSFDPKPTPHPLVVAYGLENAYEVVEEEP